MTHIQTFVELAIEGGWLLDGKKPSYDANGCGCDDCELTGGRGHELGYSVGPEDSVGEKFALFPTEIALLDPLAWAAVGKVKGWKSEANLTVTLESYNTGPEHLFHHSMEAGYWRFYFHRFIDLLAEGKTIEEALGEILK